MNSYLFLCKGNLTEVAPRPDLSRYTLFWLYNGSSTDNPTEISTASKGFLLNIRIHISILYTSSTFETNDEFIYIYDKTTHVQNTTYDKHIHNN